MKRTNTLRVLGVVILAISISGIFFGTLREKEIVKEGKLISAEILEMPTCCNCKSIYAKLRYGNIFFTQKVWKTWCEEKKVGDSVEFYFYQKYPDTFVPKTFVVSKLDIDMIAGIALTIFGLICILYSFKTPG